MCHTGFFPQRHLESRQRAHNTEPDLDNDDADRKKMKHSENAISDPPPPPQVPQEDDKESKHDKNNESRVDYK